LRATSRRAVFRFWRLRLAWHWGASVLSNRTKSTHTLATHTRTHTRTHDHQLARIHRSWLCGDVDSCCTQSSLPPEPFGASPRSGARRCRGEAQRDSGGLCPEKSAPSSAPGDSDHWALERLCSFLADSLLFSRTRPRRRERACGDPLSWSQVVPSRLSRVIEGAASRRRPPLKAAPTPMPAPPNRNRRRHNRKKPTPLCAHDALLLPPLLLERH